jgi:hypothetical protein
VGDFGGSVARGTRTGTLVASGEPKDALLRYARDYLLACGGHVRIEGEETLSAALPDGSSVRYTTSLARARAEDEMRYLAEGSAALAEMLERSTSETRLLALRLAPVGDALSRALTACAEVPPGCGRCLSTKRASAEQGGPSCAACPLREGRLLFAGLAGALHAEMVGEREAHGAELTYVLAGRNRQGRHDEWVRVALLDETGRACPPLTTEGLAAAQPGELTQVSADALADAMRTAERTLMPAMEAEARYLRLRTEDDFFRRVEEAHATSRRLCKEEPDRAHEIEASLERELAALAEVFAVEVEAQLDSICLIATTLAEVRLRGRQGGELTLLVDRGRGIILPPLCGDCGEACTAGSVCSAGHVRCLACARVCGACGERVCPLCSGSAPAPCPRCGAAVGASATAMGARGSARHASTGNRAAQSTKESRSVENAGLSSAHLDAMKPATWRACAGWLLECEGHQLDQPEERGELVVWHGRIEERAALAAALRLPVGWPLEVEHVRRVAALAAGREPQHAVLLSTAMPIAEARQEAARLGLRLLAGEDLEETLARLASAHLRERAQAHEDGQQRATAATTTRRALLAALKAAESGLRKVGKANAATSRPAVVAAAEEVSEARQAAARALLAWDTLVADWLAAFADRSERDGTLRIAGDASDFTELTERGGHLREALVAGCQQLQRTPVAGEFGYDAWRALVMEELTLRLEALRWRISMVDPTRWEDYSSARDLTSEAAATRATTGADRAAARAEQAYAQLAQRAGLEK